jgi:hypothetical protein
MSALIGDAKGKRQGAAGAISLTFCLLSSAFCPLSCNPYKAGDRLV